MGIKIKVNGHEYDGVEAMPPEIKELYDAALKQLGPAGADRDGNGVPDIADAGSCCESQVTFTNKDGAVEVGFRNSLLVVACLVGAVLLALALFHPK